MAQVDGSSNTVIAPYRSPFGAYQIRHFRESTCASSKTIQIGDIVCFDTVVSTHQRILVAPSSQGGAANLLQNGITSLVGIAPFIAPRAKLFQPDFGGSPIALPNPIGKPSRMPLAKPMRKRALAPLV